MVCCAEMSMQSDKFSGNKDVELWAVVTAMNVSILGRPLGPRPFDEFVELEDWAERICKRL